MPPFSVPKHTTPWFPYTILPAPGKLLEEPHVVVVVVVVVVVAAIGKTFSVCANSKCFANRKITKKKQEEATQQKA